MDLDSSVDTYRQPQRGSTLVEVMIVVLIIAILIAVGLPNYLGARERAQNRAAQSDLRNGLTAEKIFYADDERYTGVAAEMDLIEPSLDWGGDLTFRTSADGQTVCLSQVSGSGAVFALAHVATGASAGKYFNHGPCPAPVTAAAVSGWPEGGW